MKKRFPFIFAITLTCLVAAMPILAEWMKEMPRFGRMHRDIDSVSGIVQGALCWPWGKLFVHPWWRIAVALPWFLLVGFGLKMLHQAVEREVSFYSSGATCVLAYPSHFS